MDYIVNTFSNLIHQTAFFNLTWGNFTWPSGMGSSHCS